MRISFTSLKVCLRGSAWTIIICSERNASLFCDRVTKVVNESVSLTADLVRAKTNVVMAILEESYYLAASDLKSQVQYV